MVSIMPDLFADAEEWIEVDKENYEEEVLGSEKPVLLEFWGKKCEKCEAVTPMIKEVAKDYYGNIKLCHWECPCLYAVRELNVRNLPTLYFYKDGERVKEISKKDQIDKKKLREGLETLL